MIQKNPIRNSLDEHIEITPGVCSGKPRIAGTRIRVQDVGPMHEFHGMSAEQIAAEYPHISMADVFAALAYYYDHRDEIHRQMKEDEVYAQRMMEGPLKGKVIDLRP